MLKKVGIFIEKYLHHTEISYKIRIITDNIKGEKSG